ncbi:hypothetical protein GOV04_04755 [Candidatus Woesearchaeota archaeon]|nr:hypothetical protein [Candidatus Woesearchaeota archaeon]
MSESLFVIIFLIFLGYLLFVNRKKLELLKPIFPLLYVVLWRTKAGLKAMDFLAKKYPKSVRFFGYTSMVIGILAIPFMAYLLIKSLIVSFLMPAAPAGVQLVLPIKSSKVFYVPFFYWIISIFSLAIIHEFAHGVVARAHGIKVKSSGFAVFAILIPIIPAAFVEPDEKQVLKKKPAAQLSMFAAGPAANIFAAFLILFFSAYIFFPWAGGMFEPDGLTIAQVLDNESYPAFKAGISQGEVLKQIDNNIILSRENFTSVLLSYKPGDNIVLTTDQDSYNITLVERPEDSTLPYVGVMLEQSTKISASASQRYGVFFPSVLLWLSGLVQWMIILNLGIGLFNLVPLGPIDGGRMTLTILKKYFSDDLAMRIFKYISMFFLALLLVLLLKPMLG